MTPTARAPRRSALRRTPIVADNATRLPLRLLLPSRTYRPPPTGTHPYCWLSPGHVYPQRDRAVHDAIKHIPTNAPRFDAGCHRSSTHSSPASALAEVGQSVPILEHRVSGIAFDERRGVAAHPSKRAAAATERVQPWCRNQSDKRDRQRETTPDDRDDPHTRPASSTTRPRADETTKAKPSYPPEVAGRAPVEPLQ